MRSHLLPPDNRRLFWRRAALAPACLLLVAGLHWYRVRHCEQSQWKGGGFGMFSTVDAPKARVLRVYATTPSGRRPVAIPERLQKIASELRTAPSQTRVDELAAALAKLSYHDEQAEQHARGAKIDAALRQGKTLDGSAVGWAVPTFSRDNKLEGVGGHSPPYKPGESRALTAAKESSGLNVTVSKIEVEVWRTEFSRAERELTARPLFTGTAHASATP